jgi:hypothetical protein
VKLLPKELAQLLLVAIGAQLLLALVGGDLVSLPLASAGHE